MKRISQRQFSNLIFTCAFCNYESRLNLTECPECGRAGARQNTAIELAVAERRFQEFEVFANALPVAESYIYVCEHCCYQASGALGECPECGRNKFARFEVSANRRDRQDFRYKNTQVNLAEIGKFIQILSISFFVAAFLTFLGFGPGGHNRRTGLIAALGENWHIALMFFVLGIGSVIAGGILRSKN